MKAGLTRILICLLGVANIATPHVSAQASASFTLQPNQQDSTVLEIDNKCKQPESFSITKSPDNSMSSWIQPAQNFVSDVPSGGSKSVTINYSSEGLAAGATRTAGLVVKCASCSGNCTSITDQKFTVLLNVISAGGGSGSGSGPTGNPAGGTNPQGAGNPSGNPTNNPTNPGGPGTTNPQTPGSGATSKPTGHSSSDGAVSNPGIPGTTTPSGSTPNGSDNPSTTPQSTVPSGSDSSVPLIGILGGILALAGTLAGLFWGSGRSPVATSAGTNAHTTSKDQQSGDWSAQINDDPSDAAGTPGTATGQGPGTLSGTGPGTTTVPTPGTGGTPQSTGTGSAHTPASQPGANSTGASNQPGDGGQWGARMHQGAAEQIPGGAGQTAPANPGMATSTTEKADKDNGQWGAQFGQGTGERVATTPPTVPGGSGGVPPTQSKDNAQGENWGAQIGGSKSGTKPGETNAGGGHTFSRNTTPEEAKEAGRPLTPEETAAASTPGGGNDDYATREKLTRKGMKDIRKEDEREHVRPFPVSVLPPPPPKRSKPREMTPEDKDRLAYIDKKIEENNEKGNTEAAKIWEDLRKEYDGLGKDKIGMIDELRDLERFRDQSIADGDGGPGLVEDYVAFWGWLTDKIPGIRQLGQAFLGLSNRPLSEYGRTAWLNRAIQEQEYLIYLYRTQGPDAVKAYLHNSAEFGYYGAVPGMAAGGAIIGTSATGGALRGSMPTPGVPRTRAVTPSPETTGPSEGEAKEFLPNGSKFSPNEEPGTWLDPARWEEYAADDDNLPQEQETPHTQARPKGSDSAPKQPSNVPRMIRLDPSELQNAEDDESFVDGEGREVPKPPEPTKPFELPPGIKYPPEKPAQPNIRIADPNAPASNPDAPTVDVSKQASNADAKTVVEPGNAGNHDGQTIVEPPKK